MAFSSPSALFGGAGFLTFLVIWWLSLIRFLGDYLHILTKMRWICLMYRIIEKRCKGINFGVKESPLIGVCSYQCGFRCIVLANPFIVEWNCKFVAVPINFNSSLLFWLMKSPSRLFSWMCHFYKAFLHHLSMYENRVLSRWVQVSSFPATYWNRIFVALP